MNSLKKRSRGYLLGVGVVLALTVAAGTADAASPGWKLLAVTGPTNLPPTQSEIQRVTVEAGGGSFQLSAGAGAGKLTPTEVAGTVSSTEGSPVLTIESGTFEVGARLLAGGLPFGDNFVVSCSADCKTPGTTVTVSTAAEYSSTGEFVLSFLKEATVVEGIFPVGAELHATEAEYFLPETVVTGASGSTVSLSKPASLECIFCEAVAVSATEKTAPIAYDATSSTVQSALEAVPAFGPGSVNVTGGPGGDASHPYFIDFGGVEGQGPLAEIDVEQLEASGASLEGEHHAVHIFTTLPGGPGTGEIAILPANVGGTATSGKVEVRLGPLPTGIVTAGEAIGREGAWVCPGSAGESVVTCTSEVPISALSISPGIQIPVEVRPNAPASSSVPVVISGGGGGSASYVEPITVSKQEAPFGAQAFWGGAFDSDGHLETQAGGHPAGAAAYFALNTVRSATGKVVPVADPKDVAVDLPPGFLGNPMVTPRCPQNQLSNPEQQNHGFGTALCNENMRIGTFTPVLAEFGNATPGEGFSSKVYNDVPAGGYAGEFTTLLGSPEISILASVRVSDDFGVRVAGLSLPTYDKVYGAFTALEGNPAGATGKAFLTNPTACAEGVRQGPVATVLGDSWQEPGKYSAPMTESIPPVIGCDKLQFTPSLGFQPTATQGSSGIGATVHLHLPQRNLLNPSEPAEPALKKAVVVLPPGLNVNASSAQGLDACSEQQIGYIGSGVLPNPDNFDEEPPHCPEGSKLGTVDVSTPLLDEELHGTVYLAEQERNPFGSLLALYLAIESPRFGLQVKLAGKVEPDPATGQLTATFDHNPQVPVEDLTLHLRGGGPRSELATPEVCGHYETTGSLEPWSAPESGPPAQIREAGFDVSGNCAPSADRRPFAPSFEAGTRGTQAGAYSPLVIKVGRKDGEQELRTLEFTLPRGVTGKLAGISYCPEGAIAAAKGKSGRAEQASPSCPRSSEIGTVDAAAGVGPEPIHVAGHVYLAGPYKGAPFSSVVITPAVAGPFDLGDVVVRAPLYLDLETAKITARSDELPTILKGIPLKVRSIAIDLDRPDFTLDPTNCEAMASTASIGGSSGAIATPTSRFQVGGCSKLRFKPKLKLSLGGATKRTGHPALKAVVTYPKQGAYSNIARAQVGLPHSEFLDQGNLSNVCTQPDLKAGTCPKRSIYGHAKAWTPLLDEPLEGPVYLGVGFGYQLPALVADLNGQVRILLKGKVDTTKHHGIRNTFEAVPDAPVSRFVLKMKGGKKYGLLENSENICRKPQRLSARFVAQNGLSEQLRPKIRNDCGIAKRSRDSGGR